MKIFVIEFFFMIYISIYQPYKILEQHHITFPKLLVLYTYIILCIYLYISESKVCRMKSIFDLDMDDIYIK